MKRLRRFFARLGPGFITGASDDDPSGIATYSQAGAQFGYTQLWTALFTLPFMIVVQEMCGRIGLVTGKGLASVIRQHYPKQVLYGVVLLLLFANTINIGANLGAMASAAQLLIPLPFSVLLLGMTVLTLVLEIFVSYVTYTKYLKYLAISLLAYIVTLFVTGPNWPVVVMATLWPHIEFSSAYLLNIIAILGTTISPYLFFWQANQEVEELKAHRKLKLTGVAKPKITERDFSHLREDTVSGMAFSNLVMFFIIATAATTLHANGIFVIETAPQAAEALRPLAGDAAFWLFALGIIGTGFLSVPVLAGSASYAFSEAFGWQAGLSRKLHQAHGFYGVITISTLIGLGINYLPISPFRLLYYAAILNGICAPFLLVIILGVCNNKKIMGKRTNTLVSNVGGIITTACMFGALILLLVTMV